MTSTIDEKITVLLIDDQSIIGEAISRMLATEPDIVFHYCSDPTLALKAAKDYSADKTADLYLSRVNYLLQSDNVLDKWDGVWRFTEK